MRSNRLLGSHADNSIRVVDNRWTTTCACTKCMRRSIFATSQLRFASGCCGTRLRERAVRGESYEEKQCWRHRRRERTPRKRADARRWTSSVHRITCAARRRKLERPGEGRSHRSEERPRPACLSQHSRAQRCETNSRNVGSTKTQSFGRKNLFYRPTRPLYDRIASRPREACTITVNLGKSIRNYTIRYIALLLPRDARDETPLFEPPMSYVRAMPR